MELELHKKLIEHFFSELEYVTWVFTQCGSRKIMRYVLNCKEHVFFSLYYCFLNWGRLSIFIENQTSKNNNHKKTQLFSVHGVTKWLDLIFIRHNAAFDKHLPIIQASMHIRNTFYFSHFSSPFYSGLQKDAENHPIMIHTLILLQAFHTKFYFQSQIGQRPRSRQPAPNLEM